MNISVFHCVPAPVVPVGCILKTLSMLIFVSTLFGAGEGEQDPSDYWVGKKLVCWWLGINFLLLVIFQSSLIDLKEHASSLASAGLKRDSKLKSLEIAIEQKKEECSKLEAQLKKVSCILKQTNKINRKNKNQHPTPSVCKDALIYSSGVNLKSTRLMLFADACIKYCWLFHKRLVPKPAASLRNYLE